MWVEKQEFWQPVMQPYALVVPSSLGILQEGEHESVLAEISESRQPAVVVLASADEVNAVEKSLRIL